MRLTPSLDQTQMSARCARLCCMLSVSLSLSSLTAITAAQAPQMQARASEDPRALGEGEGEGEDASRHARRSERASTPDVAVPDVARDGGGEVRARASARKEKVGRTAGTAAIEGNYIDRGLGFLRQFRAPGKCKDSVDELAGAMTSLSPETWGAAVGLAVGVAAGAASTHSIMGAVRGGILAGSIGSALGHLADVLIPERMAELADDLQDLIQERDGKVCELVRAGDRLRTPVVEHLTASLERECRLDPVPDPEHGPSVTAALRRCVRENPRAARIVEGHLSVMRTINRGTCSVAASLVHRLDRVIADKASHSASSPSARGAPGDGLLPICEDVEDDADNSDDAAAADRIGLQPRAGNTIL